MYVSFRSRAERDRRPMTELPAGIIALTLSPVGDVGTLSHATNVYLATGDRPALIGTGHPASAPELLDALQSHGVRGSDIDRIVVGSWDVEVLGGCAAFPRADVFVASDDMVRPRAWNSWCDARRARFLGVADEVFERIDTWGRAELEPWLAVAFPQLTNHLDFTPIRAGQSVRVGELNLEVVDAGGPGPAHAFLVDSKEGVCFCGQLAFDGLPLVESARDYMVSLERATELGPTWLLPTHGRPTSQGARTLKRLATFCNNYASGLSQVLREPKTLLEVVDGDLGHLPEHPAAYIEELLRHRSFLEDLVAQHALLADGEGLDRRYSKG